MNKNIKKCGVCCIIGRPNVGKSTILNSIIGNKLTITSRKPQTTRNCILGIKTIEFNQAIFVDTPGMDKKYNKNENNYLNKLAKSTLKTADIIIFVTEINIWTDEDEHVLRYIKNIKINTKNSIPIFLIINKIDKVNKNKLLLAINSLSKKMAYNEIIPVSAKTKLQINKIFENIINYLPVRNHLFGKTQITNKDDYFLLGEIIREKLINNLNKELPYSLEVKIEKIHDYKDLISIYSCIIVKKSNHKKIIIGKNGIKIKQIGIQARKDMEKIFNKKIYIKLWVKTM